MEAKCVRSPRAEVRPGHQPPGHLVCTYIDALGPQWFRCSTRPLPTLGKCALVESSPGTDTGTRIQVQVVCLGGEGRRVKKGRGREGS